LGLVIGAIAKLVMPGKDPGGIIVTMLLGIAGSIVATWLGRVVGLYQEGQSAGFIMSVAGAVLLLALYRIMVRRRSPLEFHSACGFPDFRAKRRRAGVFAPALFLSLLRELIFEPAL
jgi:uncharacterized membrane protein YeaQ/YmgE (transglycosylase-associated protein family)